MKKPLEEVLKEATPGLCGIHSDNKTVVMSELCVVADCCTWHGPHQKTCEANAALLAHFRNVGPELVEELESLCREYQAVRNAEGYGRKSEILEGAKALLRRAKEVEVP